MRLFCGTLLRWKIMFGGLTQKKWVFREGGEDVRCYSRRRRKSNQRVTYVCKIRDLNGRVTKIKALGLESITKPMECPLTAGQLRKMFPSLSFKQHNHLEGTEQVDYLIELSKASWQPQ